MAFPSKQTVTALSRDAQKAAAIQRKEKKELAIHPKTKAAIELMVFEGLKRPVAAQQAGVHDDTLRLALRKTEVLAFMNELQEVLRNSLRPRALHTMGELLDSKNDSTKFKAAEYLDGQNRGTHTVGATQVNVQVNNSVTVTPGYVIRIDRTNDKRAPQIDHLEQDDVIPLETLSDVPEED